MTNEDQSETYRGVHELMLPALRDLRSRLAEIENNVRETERFLFLIEENLSLSIESRQEDEQEDDTTVLDGMKELRRLAGMAHDIRKSAGIEVRQPLAALFVKRGLLPDDPQFLEILRDEVNVKKVVVEDQKEDIRLDLGMTSALLEEGTQRWIGRQIQMIRKGMKASPTERIMVTFPFAMKAALGGDLEKLASVIGANRIAFGDVERGYAVTTGRGGKEYVIRVEKAY